MKTTIHKTAQTILDEVCWEEEKEKRTIGTSEWWKELRRKVEGEISELEMLGIK